MEPTCTEDQQNAVTFVPMDTQSAIVRPHGFGGNERLYLAVVTLPAGACIKDRVRDGAVVLYVQQGSVNYFAQLAGAAGPQIRRGGSTDPDAVSTVALDTLTTLNQNDWISQDRIVEMTITNPGPGQAVIVAAAFSVPPRTWTDAACKTRCRERW